MEIEEDDDFPEERFERNFEEEDDEDYEEEVKLPSKKARSQSVDFPEIHTTTTTTTTTTSDKKLPLIEKYRPVTLNDVVAQDDIIQTISRLMEKNALPHLLLYGPPGTGKTSTILALARKMFGSKQLGSMVLELNASDARGIDDIRESVVSFASTRKIFSSGMKLVILDEADNMTKDAQFALRRVIEKYTANTRFCLICNYVSKIIPALQSRCTRFRFSPLNPLQVKARVREICEKESINVTEDGMEALLKLARGDMRKVLNLLEASSMQKQDPIVNFRLVYQVAGKPTPMDVDEIVDILMNETDLAICVQRLQDIQIDKGLALVDLVFELHQRIRTMELPQEITKFFLVELAEMEFRLSTAVDESIQLHGLIAVFLLARHQIGKGL